MEVDRVREGHSDGNSDQHLEIKPRVHREVGREGAFRLPDREGDRPALFHSPNLQPKSLW